MTEIPDQIPIWDKKHNHREHENLRGVPSPLAKLAEPIFTPKSKILELGCGVGRDSVFFAGRGHSVIATDGSPTVVRQNLQDPVSGVEFSILNLLAPLPFSDETFDVVYANLSLHYFSDTETRRIIKEINRVLGPQGILSFACKSYDSLHNEGREVEPDVFVSPNGVTIHLFSQAYARSLMEGSFNITHLDEIEEEYNGRYSRIVRCISKKAVEVGRGK